MIFWQYMPSRSEALFCHLAHEWRICCRDGAVIVESASFLSVLNSK